MTLTPVQQRTLDTLVSPGAGEPVDDGLEARIRGRLDAAARALNFPFQLWLGKSRLNDLERCEGTFFEGISGRSEPFEHSPNTAAGALAHKAIEIDVGARDMSSPHDTAELAVARLDDERFRGWWREQDASEQDAIVMETVRRIEQFRASFPPLRPYRDELRPVPELYLKGEFAEAQVVFSGRVDLMLGPLVPGQATRVLLDLKTGGARPEHAEDMRLYALLHLLRFGVPPRRVATFFLDSGGWQPEDVTEQVLDRAVERLLKAMARAAELLSEASTPRLTVGPWCGWCPVRLDCPERLAQVASEGHP